MKTKRQPKRPLTPAQADALIAEHKPSWCAALSVEYNKQRFPSLTQGADRLTDGKYLAGELSIMRHHDSTVTVPPSIGARLEEAIVEQDTDFLRDFREASESWNKVKRKDGKKRRSEKAQRKRLNPRRRGDIYDFMLRHTREVEACRTPREIWRLIRAQFPDEKDFRKYYKLFAKYGLPKPVSEPR